MIKRFAAAVVFLAGVALAAALAVHAGLGATAHALEAIGWPGLVAVGVLQLLSLAFCAGAWRLVAEGASLGVCFIARWIRDGGSSAGAAAASTIVDVAIEALAQALYTVVAFVLLLPHLTIVQAPKWTFIVALGIIPILLMFWISRDRRALGLVQKVGLRLAKVMGVEGDRPFDLAGAVQTIYARRGRISGALGLHLLAWGVAAAQIWLAARGMGHPLSLADSTALAGLVSAARSAFFLVPWAAGVQEGGFLLVGGALGLDPAVAIAMSFVLRARDVLVGAPAILVWYLAEGRRSLERRTSGQV